MIGDHIRTLKAGRWLHAIDCGDETVIGLAEEAAQPPCVRRDYRPEFVAGADAVEVVTHRERTFPPEEVVARAYSRISEPALASMFRDSEAFAEWCTTGRLPGTAPNVAVSVADVTPRSGKTRKAKPARQAKPAREGKTRAAAGKRKPARPQAKRARGARPARSGKPPRRGGKALARPKAAKKRGARRTRRPRS